MELAAKGDTDGGDDFLDDYIAGFFEDCRLRGMVQYSIHTYAYILRNFKRHLVELGVLDVADIDKDAVREYVRILREERKLCISTIENHLSCISALFEYLMYEGVLDANFALPVRRRYVRRYKAERPNDSQRRKLVTTEQIKTLIDSVLIPRDKAVIMLLAKTGVRRNELVTIDINDVDFSLMKIILKPKAKRSNRVVLFDEECLMLLQDWLLVRKRYERPEVFALFITESGGRLDRNGVYNIVTSHAALIGLHDPASKRLEDHFTPHCLRHWFTTILRRNGMPREMVQELRGGSRTDSVDVYYHIDQEQMRVEYLRRMPRLGVRWHDTGWEHIQRLSAYPMLNPRF